MSSSRFCLGDSASSSTTRSGTPGLESAQLWDEIPGVRVAGVALVGHGVFVGEFRPSDER
jgi:hypothetical protein